MINFDDFDLLPADPNTVITTKGDFINRTCPTYLKQLSNLESFPLIKMTVLFPSSCDCQGFFNRGRFILGYVWCVKLKRKNVVCKYDYVEKSKSTARYKNGLVEGLYFTADLNSDLYGFISLNQKIVLEKIYHVL